MTDHDPTPVTDLAPGDRFTFGEPKNRECVFERASEDRIFFRYADGIIYGYSAPISGAKVWRV